MKNFKLKSINVFFNPTETSISEIENIPKLKELVYEELYNSISHASNLNKSTTQLFELNNTGYVVEMEKEKWVPALEKAIKFYEKKEEFEKCVSYKNLIQKIYESGNRTNPSSHKQSIKYSNGSKEKTPAKKRTSRKKSIH